MEQERWDILWINGAIASFSNLNKVPYGLFAEGAMAIKNNKIAWVGNYKDLPGRPDKLALCVKDLSGRCVTPGFIDCHTHLIYAGNRYKEFEMRLQGKSYADIAHSGGGIWSTVLATRAISERELLAQSVERAKTLYAEGVTTIEIKSGYGLDFETELKILRVAKQIGELLPINVCATFLGAHTLPKEFVDRADHYIDFLCNEMIPLIAKEKLASAVDVFCETIGFSLAQTERVFSAAKLHGLRIKCHAEQLSNSQSAELSAIYEALSVDHLEFISEKGIKAISKSGTVAVLLPGAFYFLKEKKRPPISLLREYQVPIAIATDSNPGTSPITSLILIMNMACILFDLSPEEALLGVTRNAAKALGLEKTHGELSVGKMADFVIWDVKHPVEIIYNLGRKHALEIYRSPMLS